MNELLDINAKADKIKKPMIPTVVSDLNGTLDDLNEKVDKIRTCCKAVAVNYVKIGFYLKDIQDNKLYLRGSYDGYYSFRSFEEFALKTFGFSKTTSYGLVSVVNEFCDWQKRELGKLYTEYTYSQLLEMCSLPYNQRKTLTPKASVRDIRELKDIWERYGFDEKQTWETALRKGRERKATESAEARNKQASEKATGLLALLSTATPPETVVPTVTEETTQPVNDGLNFKNDTERKAFLEKDNCRKWQLYVEIPQLDLHFYRYELKNGDSIIAEIGKTYVYGRSEPTESFRLHLQTKEKPKFDTSGIAVTYIIDYLKKNKDEI